ncbi:hypothetical protein I4U23_008551 [Adineta vaga]|nr:hypothetical protein I4U23_008551 [Adineta vaga]
MNTNPIASKSKTPISFPLVRGVHQRTSFHCNSCPQHDFSSLKSISHKSSNVRSAQDDYRLQISYNIYYSQRHYLKKRFNAKQRWKIYGTIFIFYFMLRKNLRLTKKKFNYYEYDYHRIRFFELLTVVHRAYLDPNCSIYQTLSHVIRNSIQLLDQRILFHCVQVIFDQITNLIPKDGLIGTCSYESVLIYLANCSLDQYPTNYFWSIEKHLLSISYIKMKQNHLRQLDHFTTKFLIISIFIFRGLIKTLLFKPIKYRLICGQLNHTQWLNILQSMAPQLNSWASEYADRLQRHMIAMKTHF